MAKKARSIKDIQGMTKEARESLKNECEKELAKDSFDEFYLDALEEIRELEDIEEEMNHMREWEEE